MADRAATGVKPRSPGTDRPRSPGVISILEIYRVEEAKARLGWTDSALRAAKRRGLNLIACGKRRYVTGKEILRFLENQQSEPSR